MRWRILAIGAIIAGMALAAFAVLRSGSDDRGSWSDEPVATADERALAASDAFLDRYLDPDGRVVRHDQGGDTVSEGQAYAMLIAVGADDHKRFDLAWRWTQDNLQRPDGLLSFLWRDGKVADPQPASDADLDATRALLLAASRFHDKTYRREAIRIAQGIAKQETARIDGQELLLAGPWAHYENRLVVNPSYFAPRSYAMLSKATGADVWRRLSTSSRRIAAELTAHDTRLPPNWAVVREGMEIRATGPPSNEGEAPKYGFDAARVPLRYAESCDGRDRAIAAGVWRVLSPRGIDQLSARHDLDGERDEDVVHPVSLVGAAGAAQAAGDRQTMRELLRRAEKLEEESSTYYGSALIALGRLMLTTHRLGRCGRVGKS